MVHPTEFEGHLLGASLSYCRGSVRDIRRTVTLGSEPILATDYDNISFEWRYF
jgi:hypothetical protein